MRNRNCETENEKADLEWRTAIGFKRLPPRISSEQNYNRCFVYDNRVCVLLPKPKVQIESTYINPSWVATGNGKIFKNITGSRYEKSVRLKIEPHSCNTHQRNGHKNLREKSARLIPAARKLQRESGSRTRGDRSKVYDDVDSQVEVTECVATSKFPN